MSLPRSARPAAASATSGSVSTSPARNDRWPASTATDRPHTSAPTDRAPSHDPDAEQWAGFVTELLALGFDPADLVSVATQAAADRDYPHDVRDLISRRACQLAQHACTPTAAVALFAVRTRAIVLDDAGHHQQAADLWGQLITRHENAHQPGPAQQARLAHAACLHLQGRCFEALDEVLFAWQTATQTADEDAPTVATVVRLYRLMLDACHSRAGTTVTHPAIPGMAEQPTDGGGTVLIAGAFEHRRVCAYQARTTSKGCR